MWKTFAFHRLIVHPAQTVWSTWHMFDPTHHSQPPRPNIFASTRSPPFFSFVVTRERRGRRLAPVIAGAAVQHGETGGGHRTSPEGVAFPWISWWWRSCSATQVAPRPCGARQRRCCNGALAGGCQSCSAAPGAPMELDGALSAAQAASQPHGARRRWCCNGALDDGSQYCVAALADDC